MAGDSFPPSDVVAGEKSTAVRVPSMHSFVREGVFREDVFAVRPSRVLGSSLRIPGLPVNLWLLGPGEP